LLWRNGLRSQGKWQVLHASFMRRRVELPGDPPLYMGAPAGKKRIYVASPFPCWLAYIDKLRYSGVYLDGPASSSYRPA